jgi:hypothetical protein
MNEPNANMLRLHTRQQLQRSPDDHVGSLLHGTMCETSIPRTRAAITAAVQTTTRRPGIGMAQAIVSWFICDGRYRVHAIDAVGRHRARIIEIEDVDSGERVHGTARRLERLFVSLGSSGVGTWATASLSRNQTR